MKRRDSYAFAVSPRVSANETSWPFCVRIVEVGPLGSGPTGVESASPAPAIAALRRRVEKP